MHAERFGEAIRYAGDLVRRAGVMAELLNVGGGFPIFYKDGDPIDLTPYMSNIEQSLEALPMVLGGEVFAEPGRALVAEAESLIVRVDARRDNELFINDGGYGVLYDAANCDWVFPVRLLANDASEYDKRIVETSELTAFQLWGPTCDAADHMKGPFLLPACVKEGDYLEIHKTGAYGGVMASGFNGFGCYEEIFLEDDVMVTNFAPVTDTKKLIKLIS
jgi:ornithine decarboxylase